MGQLGPRPQSPVEPPTSISRCGGRSALHCAAATAHGWKARKQGVNGFSLPRPLHSRQGDLVRRARIRPRALHRIAPELPQRWPPCRQVIDL